MNSSNNIVNYSALSVPAALITFLMTAAVINQVVTGALPVIIGIGAGLWVHHRLNLIDTTRLEAATRTRSVPFPVSYPVVFGCFRRALSTFVVEGVEPKRFTVTLDDEHTGKIEAHIHLSERDAGIAGELGKRTVTVYLEAQINPDGSGTQARWCYRLHGSRTIEGENAIKQFEHQLYVLISQQMGGPTQCATC